MNQAIGTVNKGANSWAVDCMSETNYADDVR